MAGVLFEDIFNVKDIDPEGKKFDRGKLAVIDWGAPICVVHFVRLEHLVLGRPAEVYFCGLCSEGCLCGPKVAVGYRQRCH